MVTKRSEAFSDRLQCWTNGDRDICAWVLLNAYISAFTYPKLTTISKCDWTVIDKLLHSSL